MSSDFDPFSSSPSKNYYSGDEKPKKNNFITIILIIALIGLAFYYGSSYLLVSKVDITLNIQNTEGETVYSKINISKDREMTNQVLVLDNGITDKISPGNYYYTVQAPGYLKEVKEFKVEKKTNYQDLIILEKDVSLLIHSIEFPESVYVGQTALLKIEYENTSTNKTYNISDLVLKGDIEEWNYVTIDTYQNEIEPEFVFLSPKTRSVILLRYTVQDTGNKKNNIEASVKYKKSSKTATFEIIEEPNINVTGNLTKTINSGETTNMTITINNSRNKMPLTDITFDLNISGNGSNQDIEEWFNFPTGNIFIEASKNKTETLNLNVPEFAREDVIEGKLLINSSAFREAKELEVKINIKEPEIDFSISLNKSNVTLNYDVNNNTTNNEYIDLTLNNKSTIDLQLLEIVSVDIDPIRQDCNNYIFIPENMPANLRVTKKSNPKVSITITAKETSLIGSLINNERICSINVSYKNPFRPEDIETKSESIIIKIDE